VADTIVLIDGLNFLYRGNIEFKKTEKSSDYTAVFLFFKNLTHLIEEFSPAKVFFVLEGKNNFRYQLFSEYKANRIVKKAAALPKEVFDAQRDIVIGLLPYLPITMVKADGFEADDTIYNLALNMVGEDIVVVSTDKDYTQLLQKNLSVRVFNPTKKEFVEAPEYHFLTFLSLAGDTADNIPSIVSEASAKELAQNPDALIEFLSGEENRANFNLNRQLIEFARFDESALEFIDHHTDFPLLKQEFERMEFKSVVEPAYWIRFCKAFGKLR